LDAEINGELREGFMNGRGRAKEDAEIRHWVDLRKSSRPISRLDAISKFCTSYKLSLAHQA
jgi:hypothetical protein